MALPPRSHYLSAAPPASHRDPLPPTVPTNPPPPPRSQKRERKANRNYGKSFKPQATKEDKQAKRKQILASIGEAPPACPPAPAAFPPAHEAPPARPLPRRFRACA